MKRVYDRKKFAMSRFSIFFAYLCTPFKRKRIKKNSKMAPIVVSRDCVQKGNSAINRSERTSLDGGNVLVQSRTVFGSYRMTFSRDEISKEAKKAFRKVVRK